MIPADLRYTKEHEWVRVEGDVATVGITQHAADQLGDIDDASKLADAVAGQHCDLITLHPNDLTSVPGGSARRSPAVRGWRARGAHG